MVQIWQACILKLSRLKRRAWIILSTAIIVTVCIAVTQACHGRSSREYSVNSRLYLMDRGFRIAIENVAEATWAQARKERRWWTWQKQPPSKIAVADALAIQAEIRAKEAMQRELLVRQKLGATLKRRGKKHKKLVKILAESGWHLSVKDQAADGALRNGGTLLKQYLESAAYNETRQLRAQQAKGRGIVMSAGGPVMLANAYVTLHMLQHVHKCTLPVEIYYHGIDEFDMGSQSLFMRNFKNVRCVDDTQFRLPAHQTFLRKDAPSKQHSGWMTKAQMLFLTSFEEILVLDSDNVPLADPSFLFDLPEYKRTGNLFWPDFWTNNFMNPGSAYRVLGLNDPWLEDPSLSTTESGQFLINRKQHDDVLEWIVFLNLHGDMVYDLMWGDKDSYRLAFSLAEKTNIFNQVEQNPANAMRGPSFDLLPAAMLKPTKSAKFDEGIKISTQEIELGDDGEPEKAYRHAGMVQMSPDGKMLFLHRTSDSKLNPELEYPEDFQPVEFVTPPLSARQAAQVHITGSIALVKFDAEKTRLCPPVRNLNLFRAAKSCGMIESEVKGSMPGDISRFFPVPLFMTQDIPGFDEQMDEGMLVFRELQHAFLSRRLLLGSPLAANSDKKSEVPETS